MTRARIVGWLLVISLATLSGCIRFYFWAGEHELAVPPEPKPTPEATPAPGWT